MAPDVERLWQIAQRDPKVKMTALTMGATPEDWLDSYKDYTGLTLPMMNGELVAKQLNVAFVPALVVVNKNTNNAYIKSGEQSFTHMYDFMTKAQGKPATITPFIKRLVQTPIGKLEQKTRGGQTLLISGPAKPVRRKARVERF